MRIFNLPTVRQLLNFKGRCLHRISDGGDGAGKVHRYLPAGSESLRHRSTLPSWIEEQYNASISMLLDNIFPNGTIIASPSRNEPDYFVRII